jgi:Domain of unknown function (DUF4401)
MIRDPQALLHALQARGLADASTPFAASAPAAAHDRPWYIGLLLGASGWVAGLFVLGFVGLLFRPDTAPAAAIAGALLLAAAWGLFRADRDGAFTAQLALALSIAGQCLVLHAMTRPLHSAQAIAASALLLQTALAFAMPHPLHRTLSTFFATIAWACTVRFTLFGAPRFWDGDHATTVALAPALGGWLLAWAPVGALLAALIRREAAWMARGWQPVVRPAVTGLVVGLAFATLVSQPFDDWRLFGSEAVATNWLALWPLLSALAALGGVAAAFALRSTALTSACAIGALLHLAHFYYALGTGLLFKSLLMLTMGGAMLLAARFATHQGARA